MYLFMKCFLTLHRPVYGNPSNNKIFPQKHLLETRLWLCESGALQSASVNTRCLMAWKIFLTEHKIFLNATLMNLMSAVRLVKAPLFCHGTFWITNLLCWGNVFCRMHRSKIEQGGKNSNFLNPCRVSSPFCVFVLVPWCVMVFPSQQCCSQPAPSIVLLASLWTCSAINTVKCSPS